MYTHTCIYKHTPIKKPISDWLQAIYIWVSAWPVSAQAGPVSAQAGPVSARLGDMLFSILSSLNLVTETILKNALKCIPKDGGREVGGNFCAAPFLGGSQHGAK